MTRLLALQIVLLTAHSALAQLPQISLKTVFPPGGQAGTTVDVSIVGGDMDEASRLLFTSPGITATPRKDKDGKVVANQFQVTIAKDVAPGLYDLRTAGLYGVSNPRIFRIDSLPEVPEKEPNNGPEEAQTVSLNTIVNARSNAQSDVDFFRVNAEAGQTIVWRSEASLIDSLMQPAISLYDSSGKRVARSRRRRRQEAVIVYTSPVAQELLVRIHDVVFAGGNGYEYRLSIDTRPVIDFVTPPVLPTDGAATVKLFGRNLMNGQSTNMTVDGVPVTQKETSISLTDAAPVGSSTNSSSLSVRRFFGIPGNVLTFAVGNQPLITEQPEGDAPQQISLPAMICGGFESRDDEDLYRFEAKKGEVWQIDVLADRLANPAAPVLIVERVTKDAEGKESSQRLTRVDSGHPNPGGNTMSTVTTDPVTTFTAPEDGTYQIRLTDRYATSRGSADLRYCVVVSKKPTPEFRIVLYDSRPSADGKAPAGTGAVSLRRGGTYQIPCYAFRRGGHNEEIVVLPRHVPAGVTARPARILPGRTAGTLVFSASEDATIGVSKVDFVAVSGGNLPDVVQPDNTDGMTIGSVQVATLAHGGANGLARNTRVAGSMMLSVLRDEQPVSLTHQLTAVDLSQDQQLLIPISIHRRAGFVEKVDIQFSGQPKNVDVPKISIPKGQDSTTARIFVKQNAAPTASIIQLTATATVPYRPRFWLVDEAKQKVKQIDKQIASATAAVEAAKQAVVETQKRFTAANDDVQKATELVKQRQTDHTMAKQTLLSLINKQAEASTVLKELQQRVAQTAATDIQDLTRAVADIADTTGAISHATSQINQFVKSLDGARQAASTTAAALATAQKNLKESQAKQQTYQSAMVAAKAKVAAAEKTVGETQAAKKAADEALKAAENASKPQNKNVRVAALPFKMTVHATPGSITAAVPNGGSVKKGTAIDVPVTVARKNKFAGPVNVQLVLPPGESRVTSNTVTIAADQTKATLKLTATADAAPGDISNAVIRATGDFNGRPSAFDAPVALKVVE